jgi:uncharacterized protein YecT (DUF1311 family)
MVAILAVALAAFMAAPDEYEAHHCDDPQSQSEMNICARIDFERADADLNATWKWIAESAREADADVDTKYDDRPGSEKNVREAQRAWITFRDAHCTYESYEARGGSMEPMLYNLCRARLTRERIEQFTLPSAEDR